MIINKCYKDSFSVIGKKGDTNEGSGMIASLWKKANHDMPDVMPLAKRGKKGVLAGCWGLRSVYSIKFKEWENDEKGLYLAGVEVSDDAVAPYGWVKWTVPASNYVYIKVEGPSKDAVAAAEAYIQEKKLDRAGAYFEYMAPEETGQLYLFFPVAERNVFFFPGKK